ncbi:uncharacterized protein MYCFIDRAFT_173684 [Pseudocercospora fijiensis CIRAD86]|uniref:Uncharacterized protein n=1 Tax=Pseudocercospora fijiensis (strain CIRAD86) TaxID=383855 RepID=M3A0U7_PSEFD|nr:uncharacterized protein MYCFIDRAFT_173684 [Pseudocercospora fijiensis CIRAD86]EME84754.1 hypothetical protein MYCFIDRAFT_173684 [Pseudocercospora fijiensis CIRAD86]
MHYTMYAGVEIYVRGVKWLTQPRIRTFRAEMEVGVVRTQDLFVCLANLMYIGALSSEFSASGDIIASGCLNSIMGQRPFDVVGALVYLFLIYSDVMFAAQPSHAAHAFQSTYVKRQPSTRVCDLLADWGLYRACYILILQLCSMHDFVLDTYQSARKVRDQVMVLPRGRRSRLGLFGRLEVHFSQAQGVLISHDAASHYCYEHRKSLEPRRKQACLICHVSLSMLHLLILPRHAICVREVGLCENTCRVDQTLVLDGAKFAQDSMVNVLFVHSIILRLAMLRYRIEAVWRRRLPQISTPRTGWDVISSQNVVICRCHLAFLGLPSHDAAGLCPFAAEKALSGTVCVSMLKDRFYPIPRVHVTRRRCSTAFLQALICMHSIARTAADRAAFLQGRQAWDDSYSSTNPESRAYQARKDRKDPEISTRLRAPHLGLIAGGSLGIGKGCKILKNMARSLLLLIIISEGKAGWYASFGDSVTRRGRGTCFGPHLALLWSGWLVPERTGLNRSELVAISAGGCSYTPPYSTLRVSDHWMSSAGTGGVSVSGGASQAAMRTGERVKKKQLINAWQFGIMVESRATATGQRVASTRTPYGSDNKAVVLHIIRPCILL